MKKQKTVFKQLDFKPNYFKPDNYLVVMELEGDTPRASFTVRIPEPISPFEKFPHFQN